jgi:hypothetical protein
MNGHQIVYLDQGHISRMVRDLHRGVTSDATDLLKHLRGLVLSGAVVCPFSLMHVLETAAWDNDAYRTMAGEVLGSLSQGKCFRSPFEIVLDEVDRVVGRAVLGTHVRGAVDPLGTGTDIYRRGRVSNDAVRKVDAIPPEEKFSFIVERSRAEGSLRVTEGYKNGTFAYLERMARLRRRVPFDQVRKIIRAGYLDPKGGMGRLAVAAANALGLPADSVSGLLAAANIDALPTLAMMAEIEARRYVSYGTGPTRSDGPDDACRTSTTFTRRRQLHLPIRLRGS